MILKVDMGYNVSHELARVQERFNCCVQTFYCKSVVAYLGHCFRHLGHPVTKLLSLPLFERLENLRLQGRRSEPSSIAQEARSFLSDAGLNLSQLVGGLPNIRGHSGMPFRWGNLCFFEIRDGGLGWNFEKTDKESVKSRTDLLMEMLWFRFRRSALPQLEDLILPLTDR